MFPATNTTAESSLSRHALDHELLHTYRFLQHVPHWRCHTCKRTVIQGAHLDGKSIQLISDPLGPWGLQSWIARECIYVGVVDDEPYDADERFRAHRCGG